MADNFINLGTEPSSGHGCQLTGHSSEDHLTDPEKLGLDDGWTPQVGPSYLCINNNKKVNSTVHNRAYWLVSSFSFIHLFTSPPFIKMGFGVWHSICSFDGDWSVTIVFTKSKKGFPVVVAWRNFNAPGPSVVPAMKLYPKAGLHT